MKRFVKAVPFIGPHFVIFVMFALFPTIYGIYIAFTRWDLVGNPQFVGFDNFREILINTDSQFSQQFYSGLLHTVLFVVIAVPLLISIPMLLALVLSRKNFNGVSVFQAIFYIPGLISVSAGALAWNLLFNREIGLFNTVFGTNIGFLTTQPWAWVTIFALTIWAGIGGNLIIYRSAVAGVPPELHEAASLDGAGVVRRFFSVTLPSIRFPLLYTIVLTTAGCFNVYGQPLMMTRGGPTDSTRVLMMTIRDLAFGSGPSIAGVAAAMSVLLGVVLMIIAAIQFRIMFRSSDD